MTRPLWLLAAAAVALLSLAQLVQVSMFFDGGIYATVARNLAIGRGEPWRLHFSDTLFPLFSEHAPLMMWLQALGFVVFGDHIAVEKGFSLAMFAIALVLLHRIWSTLHADDPTMRAAFPFAVVLLLVSGRVGWGFANGMLENPLTVFTLAAVLAILVARGDAARDRPALRWALMAAAGVAVVLAVLTKGPVGLFPLATPALHWIVFRRSALRTVIVDTLVMAAVVGLAFGALWSVEAAREAINRYLDAQLRSSLSGQRGRYGGGLLVVPKLLGINGTAIVIVSLLWVAGRRRVPGAAEAALRPARRRRAAFLLLVALSASLPIGLSPRVSNFYFNPSVCFYASCLATLGAPTLMAALAGLGARGRTLLTAGASLALLAAVVVVVRNVGTPGVDARTIAQAAAIAARACPGPDAPDATRCRTTIAACGPVWEDWALHTYLQRVHRLSLAKAAEVEATLVVTDAGCPVAPGYRDTGVDVAPYRLLERTPGG